MFEFDFHLLLDISGLLHCLVHDDVHGLADEALCSLFVCSGAVHNKAASWRTFFKMPHLCHRALAFIAIKNQKQINKQTKKALLCLVKTVFPMWPKITQKSITCHHLLTSVLFFPQ